MSRRCHHFAFRPAPHVNRQCTLDSGHEESAPHSFGLDVFDDEGKRARREGAREALGEVLSKIRTRIAHLMETAKQDPATILGDLHEDIRARRDGWNG